MFKTINIKKISVHKADYDRVVLTETLPYEVPIIFSNDGFYKHIKLNEEPKKYLLSSIFGKLISDPKKWTIPLSYKIRKNNTSLRKLSIIHPSSQLKIIELYRKYDSLICYHCTKSKISLRAPSKVATSFFKNSRINDINKYKPDSVETLYTEKIVKHSTSYFAYDRYSKFYKFMDSELFVELEKKYSYLYMLDVFKCFDSIYTHTISWAVKNKKFSKDTVAIKSTFGQYIDGIMQHCNHSETNGILIGPEISRIFAEIIFQDIDNNVIIECRKKFGYIFDSHYSIKRYVDDYFVYASSDTVIKNVVNEITDQLGKFNLYINSNKIEKYTRPFYTKSSQVVNLANKELSCFVGNIIQVEHVDDLILYTPMPIRNLLRLRLEFINNIKSICANANTDLSMVTGYIMSAIYNCILKLIEFDFKKLEKTLTVESNYRNVFVLLLDVAFYFYSVEPTVSSSYGLCKCVILSNRFFNKEFINSSVVVSHRILELSRSFLQSYHLVDDQLRDGHVPLEKLNIILALSELGDDYLMPSEFACSIFKPDTVNKTYHEIMVCLFYIKNNSIYSDIKSKVVANIKIKISNMKNAEDSESLYLLLDSLTCPYIDKSDRLEMLKNYYSIFETNTPGKVKLDGLLSFMLDNYWFVKWQNVDLLNTLEKKMLNSAY